jgi:hypothetical protein
MKARWLVASASDALLPERKLKEHIEVVQGEWRSGTAREKCALANPLRFSLGGSYRAAIVLQLTPEAGIRMD